MLRRWKWIYFFPELSSIAHAWILCFFSLFFTFFLYTEILKNPGGFRCNFETNIRLRVPATAKTTRYPPSFELVTSFLVLMVPPCFLFPASHSLSVLYCIFSKLPSMCTTGWGGCVVNSRLRKKTENAPYKINKKIHANYNIPPSDCGTQATKGKGGPRVEKKSERSEIIFSGAPGGIPIPFFAVAGTRSLMVRYC